jgi:hypothetical protein
MFRFTLLAPVLIAGASLAMASAPAIAATAASAPAAAAKPAKPVKKVAVVTKRTTVMGPAKSMGHIRTATAAKPKAPVRTASIAKPRTGTGFVTATLANGKKVTYDCHLAGNKAKTACKG